MKKIALLLFAAIATSSFAQVNWKFEPTDYRGAFAPAPTPMWTNGWTNWDPQTTVYGAPTVTVGAPYTVVWGSQLVQPLVHMGVGAGAKAPR
jgi:hypothetical protein